MNKKIAENESDPLLYDQRAKIYILDQQFDNALKDINKALALAPGNPQFYITLSDVYLLMGQTNNCEGALKQALKLQPDNNSALLRLAKLHLVLRDYPATFLDVQNALRVDAVNPQAYFTRAIALLEKGDTIRAVYDLKKAVDQDQQYYEAYMELGELYAMKKDKMAADYIRNALNVKPKSKEALYMLGMFYQENGQYDQAIETYSRLSAVDTIYRNAPYNTGYIYLVYLKDFKLAIKFFTEAIKRDPGYVEAWFNRGYANELSGEFKNAYSDYKMVLKLKTNDQKAIEGLNRLDQHRGRK
jgi:tetratricopeptide (TPR) repeat protein